MSEEDKSSKTEEPTERKLSKAREDGETWSSREAGTLMAYVGLTALVAMVLPTFLPRVTLEMAEVFAAAGQIGMDDTAALRRFMSMVAWAGAGVVLPALMVMFAGALLAVLAGGPLVATLKRVQPKPSKLNPMSGFKRIFSASNLIEFAKNLAKLMLLGWLFATGTTAAVTQLLPGSIMLPETLLPYVGGAATWGLGMVCAAMLPFVIFDIFWKRMEWMKKQRMSLKDVKDEMKNSEGDPLIRMKRRELRMKRMRRPLAQVVPNGTLVVTNPTHYAVVLRYERGMDSAPVCLAKGMDAVALKIRALAMEHDIPVLESPPLARALHAVVEEDQVIPEAHWAAVAELVGYVLDLRRRVRRKLPAGTLHVRD